MITPLLPHGDGGTCGVGVDVTSVARVSALVDRRPRFAERHFTARERDECAGRPQRWAGRWAAKEAVRKLHGGAGTPLPAFAAIEVVVGRGGAPALWIDGAPSDLRLTLSHEGDVAIAVVVGVVAPASFAPVPPGLVLAARPADAHKGSFGTVVVVGGAVGYSGAPLMSALAAARGGAGLTRLCVPDSIYLAVAAQAMEVMVHPLPAEDGGFAAGALAPLRDGHLGAAAAVVVGPGLGRAPATEAFVLALLPELAGPAVVDADALNIAAARGHDWHRSRGPVVLTPHPAEMGRLAGLSTAEVQRDRQGVAVGYAQRHGVVVVLKGADTVVAAPNGRRATSTIRSVALASGGSGDVLSGLLAALLAQGLEAFDAAVAAVFIHGEAGLALEHRVGRAGVLPRDLLDELPAAQERARRALEVRAAR